MSKESKPAKEPEKEEARTYTLPGSLEKHKSTKTFTIVQSYSPGYGEQAVHSI